MNFKRNLLQALFPKTITNQALTVLLLAVFSFFLTNIVLAAVTVPSGSITDPVAQGYATCTPGNCAIATSSAATNTLPASATFGQVLVWDGTNWVATSTLATTTSALSTTLNQTAVSGATVTGIFFLDPTTGKLGQDTSNFSYDPITKKLTVTGGIDPLFLQAKDATTGTGAYYEAYDGSAAAVSLVNTGRLRYNVSTQSWEVSQNGAAYYPIAVQSSNVVFNNATLTNATITGAFSFATGSIASTTISWLNVLSNFFANVATILNLNFTNATGTNATTTGTLVTNNLTATGTSALATTSIATLTVGSLNVSGISAPNLTGQDIIATRTLLSSGTTTLTGTSTLATTSISELTATNSTLTNATSTNFFASVFNALTGFFTNLGFSSATGTNFQIANGTTTNFAATGTTNLSNAYIASTTITSGNIQAGNATLTTIVSGNATTTNLYSTNASFTGATSTSLFANKASITEATTTNLFTAVFNAISAVFTNLIFGNATGTNIQLANATVTNIAATGSASLANILGTNATLSNATITNLAALSIRDSYGATGTVGQVLSTDGTSTKWVTPSTAAATSTYQAIQFTDGNGNFIATSTFKYSTTSGVLLGASQRVAIDTAGNVTSAHFDITPSGVPFVGTYYYFDLDLDGVVDSFNPSLTLVRGQVYRFYNNSPVDPLYITTNRASAVASAYSNGVVGNGTTTGIITFRVPQNAPANLYYQSSANSQMGGTIHIVDSTSIINDNGGAQVLATTTSAGDIVKIFASSTNMVTIAGDGTVLNGTTTMATSTFASSTGLFANIQTLWTNILSVLNLNFINATGSNATTSNFATGNLTSTTSTALASTTLSGNTLTLGDLRVMGTTTVGTATIMSIQDSFGNFGYAGQIFPTSQIQIQLQQICMHMYLMQCLL